MPGSSGILSPAENSEGVQSARPERPVETRTVNIYEVPAQLDDSNGPQIPPSWQAQSVDQGLVLQPRLPSQNAARGQEVHVTPTPIFEAWSGESES